MTSSEKQNDARGFEILTARRTFAFIARSRITDKHYVVRNMRLAIVQVSLTETQHGMLFIPSRYWALVI